MRTPRPGTPGYSPLLHHPSAAYWRSEGIRVHALGERGVVVLEYRRTGHPIRCLVLPLYEPSRVDDWYGSEAVAMLVRKSAAEKASVAAKQGCGDKDPTREMFPALFHHLTQAMWEDGSPRELSTIVIFHQEGGYRAMLKDKAESLVLWVTAPSLYELLPVLDSAAASPDADWRIDKRADAPKGRKK